MQTHSKMYSVYVHTGKQNHIFKHCKLLHAYAIEESEYLCYINISIFTLEPVNIHKSNLKKRTLPLMPLNQCYHIKQDKSFLQRVRAHTHRGKDDPLQQLALKQFIPEHQWQSELP